MAYKKKAYKQKQAEQGCLGCLCSLVVLVALAGGVGGPSDTFKTVSWLVLAAIVFAYYRYDKYKKQKAAAERAALEKARNMERIEIIYEDRRGNVTKRRISPMRLKGFDDGSWVLDAFCEDKQAQRSFYLDRIVRAIDCETGEEVKDILEYLKTWNQRHGYEDGATVNKS